MRFFLLTIPSELAIAIFEQHAKFLNFQYLSIANVLETVTLQPKISAASG
jgi:hypothetical protein